MAVLVFKDKHENNIHVPCLLLPGSVKHHHNITYFLCCPYSCLWNTILENLLACWWGLEDRRVIGTFLVWREADNYNSQKLVLESFPEQHKAICKMSYLTEFCIFSGVKHDRNLVHLIRLARMNLYSNKTTVDGRLRSMESLWGEPTPHMLSIRLPLQQHKSSSLHKTVED